MQACREDRWSEVPPEIATRLAGLLNQFSNVTESGRTSAFQTTAAATTTNPPASAGSQPPTQSYNRTSGAKTIPGSISASVESTTPVSPSNLASQVVILAVTLGQRIRLAQIDVRNSKDDQFFVSLRDCYGELRGLVRRWFGIWKYAYCDFIKVNSQCILGPLGTAADYSTV